MSFRLYYKYARAAVNVFWLLGVTKELRFVLAVPMGAGRIKRRPMAQDVWEAEVRLNDRFTSPVLYPCEGKGSPREMEPAIGPYTKHCFRQAAGCPLMEQEK